MPQQSYVIITDTDSELPLSIAERYAVPYVPMPYILKDEDYFYDLGKNTDFKAFYQALREGNLPSTYTYPPDYYVEMWTPYLQEGKDILFISFSSRLSAAFGFVQTAAETVRAQFPQRRIELIDTLNISGGMALLVYKALQLQEAGASIDEVMQAVTESIPHACALFTVDDLKHLMRGGRLSPTEAAMGSLLKIKPMLHIDDEGTIKVTGKVMGRQKSIRALAEKVIEEAIEPENNALIVLHGDAEEDGKKLLDLIAEKAAFKEIFFQYVGPVIGSHTGSGVLGVCFFGQKK